MKLTDKLLGIIAKILLVIALNTSVTGNLRFQEAERLQGVLDKVLTKQL